MQRQALAAALRCERRCRLQEEQAAAPGLEARLAAVEAAVRQLGSSAREEAAAAAHRMQAHGAELAACASCCADLDAAMQVRQTLRARMRAQRWEGRRARTHLRAQRQEPRLAEAERQLREEACELQRRMAELAREGGEARGALAAVTAQLDSLVARAAT